MKNPEVKNFVALHLSDLNISTITLCRSTTTRLQCVSPCVRTLAWLAPVWTLALLTFEGRRLTEVDILHGARVGRSSKWRFERRRCLAG
jgi:hypothetical protein